MNRRTLAIIAAGALAASALFLFTPRLAPVGVALFLSVSTVVVYRKMAASTIQPMGKSPNAAPCPAAVNTVRAQPKVPPLSAADASAGV